MTIKDDYYGFVRMKGRISKDVWSSGGGLTVTNIAIINRDGRSAHRTYIPVAWFKRNAREVPKDFEKGDIVNIDAKLSMNKYRKCRCPECGTFFQPSYYEIQVVGEKMTHAEITGEPPEPEDYVEEEGDGDA